MVSNRQWSTFLVLVRVVVRWVWFNVWFSRYGGHGLDSSFGLVVMVSGQGSWVCFECGSFVVGLIPGVGSVGSGKVSWVRFGCGSLHGFGSLVVGPAQEWFDGRGFGSTVGTFVVVR